MFGKKKKEVATFRTFVVCLCHRQYPISAQGYTITVDPRGQSQIQLHHSAAQWERRYDLSFQAGHTITGQRSDRIAETQPTHRRVAKPYTGADNRFMGPAAMLSCVDLRGHGLTVQHIHLRLVAVCDTWRLRAISGAMVEYKHGFRKFRLEASGKTQNLETGPPQ